MIKLGSWTSELEPLDVAKRAYNDNIKAAGWAGYIMVKPVQLNTGVMHRKRPAWTAYFRTTENKQGWLEYSTDLLATA